MTVDYYIRFILTSLVIIAILFIVLKLAKKYRVTATKEITIIDRLPVASNAYILLIHVRNKEYLIGATPSSFQVIDHL